MMIGAGVCRAGWLMSGGVARTPREQRRAMRGGLNSKQVMCTNDPTNLSVFHHDDR